MSVFPLIPKVDNEVGVRALCRLLKFPTPTEVNHVFMDLSLCTRDGAGLGSSVPV